MTLMIRRIQILPVPAAGKEDIRAQAPRAVVRRNFLRLGVSSTETSEADTGKLVGEGAKHGVACEHAEAGWKGVELFGGGGAALEVVHRGAAMADRMEGTIFRVAMGLNVSFGASERD